MLFANNNNVALQDFSPDGSVVGSGHVLVSDANKYQPRTRNINDALTKCTTLRQR